MNCKKIKEELLFLIDNELSEKKVNLIKAHLVPCIDCQKEYELILRVKELSQKIPEIEPSSDFDERFWIKFDKLKVDESEKLSLFDRIWGLILQPRMVPAYVLTTIFIIALSVLPQYLLKQNSMDIQVASNLELFDNFEVIENLDLMSNFDVILNLTQLEKE